jgi:hypothetical protein
MVRKPSGESPQTEFDSLYETEDFKDFLRILAVTEGVPDKLEEVDKEKIVDKYNAWVKGDRPRPSLPKSVGGIEKITRIYRRKAKGTQFISYLVEGKHEQEGMKTDIVYGKNQDGEEDRTLIVGRNRYPTIEYTEKMARDLLKKAKRYNDDVKLYFVYQTMTIAVKNEENFFGDFDKIIERAMKKEIV